VSEKTNAGELAPEENEELIEEQAEAEIDSEEQASASAGILSVEGLRDDLNRVKTQADEYLDGWQRARAEFANYKKRVAREREEARLRIMGDTLTKYLGVLDDLDRALREKPADGDAAAWAEGIELIYRKMYAVLENEGVEQIPAEGGHFDPTVHEALSHEDSGDHEEGQIIEVIRPGYQMGDRVLRPALVRVAK
jgi:molecular chaperone GrpE